MAWKNSFLSLSAQPSHSVFRKFISHRMLESKPWSCFCFVLFRCASKSWVQDMLMQQIETLTVVKCALFEHIRHCPLRWPQWTVPLVNMIIRAEAPMLETVHVTCPDEDSALEVMSAAITLLSLSSVHHVRVNLAQEVSLARVSAGVDTFMNEMADTMGRIVCQVTQVDETEYRFTDRETTGGGEHVLSGEMTLSD